MARFSQRIGVKPIRNLVQIKEMDDKLRAGLWNAVTMYYWEDVDDSLRTEAGEAAWHITQMLWLHHFHLLVDELERYWPSVLPRIRAKYCKMSWDEVYDFIEFIAQIETRHDPEIQKKFVQYCNYIFERGMSAYRFVGNQLAEITSEEELGAIESAIAETSSATGSHLKRSMEFLSDRRKPDFRNSIKESISAIEAECKLLAGSDKGDLASALAKVAKRHDLHPAFKLALEKLYAFTSDEKGIRHSLLEAESNVNFATAKFMLVAASAFIGYLRSQS